MRFVRFSFLLSAFCLSSVTAEIIETKDIKDLLKYADAETLVVSDINEVVIAAPQMLGSSAWMKWDLEKVMKERGIDKLQAFEERVPLWHKVLRRSRMETVEKSTPWVYRQLQKRGIQTVGLTNNYSELAYVTLGQLKHNHVNFASHTVYPFDREIEGGAAAKLVEGVIFVGLKNDKGDTLVRLLEQIKAKPKRILFIDDKESNVVSVQKACDKAGIPFIGLRYGYTDEKNAAFDPRIAQEQLRHFEQVIADEDAQLLLHAEESHA